MAYLNEDALSEASMPYRTRAPLPLQARSTSNVQWTLSMHPCEPRVWPTGPGGTVYWLDWFADPALLARGVLLQSCCGTYQVGWTEMGIQLLAYPGVCRSF